MVTINIYKSYMNLLIAMFLIDVGAQVFRNNLFLTSHKKPDLREYKYYLIK